MPNASSARRRRSGDICERTSSGAMVMPSRPTLPLALAGPYDRGISRAICPAARGSIRCGMPRASSARRRRSGLNTGVPYPIALSGPPSPLGVIESPRIGAIRASRESSGSSACAISLRSRSGPPSSSSSACAISLRSSSGPPSRGWLPTYTSARRGFFLLPNSPSICASSALPPAGEL